MWDFYVNCLSRKITSVSSVAMSRAVDLFSAVSNFAYDYVQYVYLLSFFFFSSFYLMPFYILPVLEMQSF